MTQFAPRLICLMKMALEDVMSGVPSEYSTPEMKAYLAECILKAAAEGHTSYNELVAAAADHIRRTFSQQARLHLRRPLEWYVNAAESPETSTRGSARALHGTKGHTGTPYLLHQRRAAKGHKEESDALDRASSMMRTRRTKTRDGGSL
jgi:hypothetical protein